MRDLQTVQHSTTFTETKAEAPTLTPSPILLVLLFLFNAHRIINCNMMIALICHLHNPILNVLGRRAVLRATAPDCSPPLPGIIPDMDPAADDADADPMDTEEELEIERFMKSLLLLLLMLLLLLLLLP